ncbi:MAG: hypothetical protein NW217_01565 [Hyphomicrobiaceae bacterium]|nr:hypothetical protein [Hyphomicrobiaceae bacterium]
MRVGGILAVVLLTGSSAGADSLEFSYNLGLIVGSADLCGYQLSDEAVLAYVESNVPGSDLGFAAQFQTHVGYHRRQAEKLGSLELKVHCDAAQRSAVHLGLLAP